MTPQDKGHENNYFYAIVPLALLAASIFAALVYYLVGISS